MNIWSMDELNQGIFPITGANFLNFQERARETFQTPSH